MDIYDLYCDLEAPSDDPPSHARCGVCPRTLKDLEWFGQSIRDRTVGPDRVVLACESVTRTAKR